MNTHLRTMENQPAKPNRNAKLLRMQNRKEDQRKTIAAIEPITKSARIKALHGLIESQIRTGVRIEQIVESLNATGMNISVATLKSYLYRLRRAQRT